MIESNFRKAIKDALVSHAGKQSTVDAVVDGICSELMRLAIEPAAYNVTWDGELTTNIYLTEEDARAAMKRLNDRFQSDKREIVPLYHAPLSPEINARVLVAKTWLNSPEALGDLLQRAGVNLTSVPEQFADMLGAVAAETTIHVCEKIAGLDEKVPA